MCFHGISRVQAHTSCRMARRSVVVVMAAHSERRDVAPGMWHLHHRARRFGISMTRRELRLQGSVRRCAAGGVSVTIRQQRNAVLGFALVVLG